MNPSQMAGLLKDIFGKYVTALPKWSVIQDKFPFEESEGDLGGSYIVGVELTKSHSAVYAAGDGSALSALPAVPTMQAPRATISSFAICIRQRIAVQLLKKAAKEGKGAFASAVSVAIRNLYESHVFRLELSLLYGRDGLGIVSGVAGQVITVTTASWAPGVWTAGLVGATLEVFASATAASTSQLNGDIVVSAVNPGAFQFTVSGTVDAIVATNVLYFKSARTTTGWNECVGLRAILANTGTMFNIDSAVYDAWRAQALAVNGNLSFTAVMQAAALCVTYGLEKGFVICTPASFANLVNDEAALRRYPQYAAMVKRGAEGLSFQMGQVEIEVLLHPHMRSSEAMLLPAKKVHRIGATDLTTLGEGDGINGVLFQVHDLLAAEARTYSDQAIYLEAPAQALLFTAIS